MKSKNGLIGAALVGTERSDWPDDGELPPSLLPLYADLRRRPFHQALPLLAGMISLHEDVGRLPAKASQSEWFLPAYRQEGDRPACSRATAAFLERMLNQRHTDLMPELLALLDSRQLRIPDPLLPHFLEYGLKTPRRRPMILPVIGERGRWLASLNASWLYATVDVSDQPSLRHVWEKDNAGRAILALYVRQRRPAAGRELIESTWRNENDAGRREQIRAMEYGLSATDEPFLERALDDRDVQVRRRAVDLLAAIPDSRLVGRVTRAAGGWLSWRNGELHPNLPSIISDQLVRDGVSRPTTVGMTSSERSRLLSQAIGVIPPAHWQEQFGVPPGEIVAAALASKWPRTLITAFSTAAGRHHNREWADAILAADNFNEHTRAVLGFMPGDVFIQHLQCQIEAENDIAVVGLLRHWPLPWDETGGRLIIDYLAGQAGHDPDTRHAPTFRYLSRQFAHQCPPGLADHAAQRFKRLGDDGRKINHAWELSLNSFASKLAYRLALHQSFEA